MRVRKLTAADVCAVTGYNRDQLRGLLKELPEWSAAPGERMARAYSAHDLIVLSVVHVLDAVVGMRRKMIAAAFSQLQEALSGPKSIAANARLIITFAPLRVDYSDGKITVAEGLIVSLQPIFGRIDQYLGAVKVQPASSQANLRLGPTLVGSRRRRGST
jgi:hypothetical protein